MAIITLPGNFFEKEKPVGLYYNNEPGGEWQKIDGLLDYDITETDQEEQKSYDELKIRIDDFWEHTFTVVYNYLDELTKRVPKISRKRFKKILMAKGFSRNTAERFCKTLIGNDLTQYKSYKDACIFSGLVFRDIWAIDLSKWESLR